MYPELGDDQLDTTILFAVRDRYGRLDWNGCFYYAPADTTVNARTQRDRLLDQGLITYDTEWERYRLTGSGYETCRYLIDQRNALPDTRWHRRGKA